MTDASRLDAFLAAQRLTDDYELSDLSPQEINRLSMADYARIRERAGLPAVDAFEQAYKDYEPQQPTPAASQSVPGATESAPQSVNVGSLTMSEYAALRGQLGVGGREYGRGALDGGSTADWIAAARSKVGRTQYGQQNTQNAGRPDASKYLAGNGPVTGRANFYR